MMVQFQALSTCKEIAAAIESGDPANFLSNLPLHQDGSCNGLQHYAGQNVCFSFNRPSGFIVLRIFASYK